MHRSHFLVWLIWSAFFYSFFCCLKLFSLRLSSKQIWIIRFDELMSERSSVIVWIVILCAFYSYLKFHFLNLYTWNQIKKKKRRQERDLLLALSTSIHSLTLFHFHFEKPRHFNLQSKAISARSIYHHIKHFQHSSIYLFFVQ